MIKQCQGSSTELDWMKGEHADCGSSRAHEPHVFEMDAAPMPDSEDAKCRCGHRIEQHPAKDEDDWSLACTEGLCACSVYIETGACSHTTSVH